MFSFWGSKPAKEPEAPAPLPVAAPPPPATPVVLSPSPLPIQQPQQAAPTRPFEVYSRRSAKQLGLFFGGAAFLAFSMAITRRAINRRLTAAMPKFYQPTFRSSAAAGGKTEGNPEGSLIALEALHLATLNVFSFGMMAAGGLSWAFDVSSIDDLRAMARGNLGVTDGQIDEAAEQEVEAWMARVLSRKELGGTDTPEETPSAAAPSEQRKA